jgi:CheY-like chemotaxis protein
MPRILLVEDNEENRDALSRRLERRGYEVITATDGKRALELAEFKVPDLILLDMSLPEIDGWEVARTLKDSEATRKIPIIALTAHAMSGDREKAIGAGCDDYHTKPAELTKLLAQIQGILKGPPK